MTPPLKLLHFHSSSTSFRVRAALNLKELPYDEEPIELRWQDGDNERAPYLALNPQANVPLLVHGDVKIAQSLAICDYLERTFPRNPLLPEEPAARAWALSLALHVACEIQPLGNLRVERYLANALDLAPESTKAWRQHWQAVGLDNVETMLRARPHATRFCAGNTPGLADCVLIPQIYNSKRPAVGLDIAARWPMLDGIYQACMALPAFDRALPERQQGYQPLDRH